MAKPRKALVGVTGGIAAFKSVDLVRQLVADGWQVRCAMTRSASSFVTPLTLEILSGHPVYRQEYLAGDTGGQELHMVVAEWADVLCVVPATANFLAKLSLGLADDFLTTTALAFRGPVLVAPAMHAEMWEKEPVRRNVERLIERGVRMLGPTVGRLASGQTGIGRLLEPAEIAEALRRAVEPGPLQGRTVLITAGPTREAADPVRYLSNRSSGKMGFALAAEAAALGADTVLVAGPVDRPTPPGVQRVDVRTALEMRDAVAARAAQADLIIMAAAVCDFRPRHPSERKLKKQSGWDQLELERNPDILAGLSEQAPHAVLVGFAAETDNLEAEARRKLADKRLDFIVANDVSRSDVGFESDHNEVTVFRRDGDELFFERQSKRVLAGRLLSLFVERVAASDRKLAAERGVAE